MMQSGILVVNKPEGLSSARVVAQVKQLLQVKKVGHTGTLDPFASGVLICCINQATRISQFFLNGDKQYRATIRLGIETDTYDLTGKVVDCADDASIQALDHSVIASEVRRFLGKQEQVPPAFSALKKDGQPLYKLARKGIKVEKPPRHIEIYGIQIIRIDLPHVEIQVHCSAGTYIRSIAHDLGKKLGCGGHLTRLVRTKSSQFALSDAVELAAMDREQAAARMVPMAEALPFLVSIEVSCVCQKKIRHGQRLSRSELGAGENAAVPETAVKLVDDSGQLLAIVCYDKNRQAYNYSCVFAA